MLLDSSIYQLLEYAKKLNGAKVVLDLDNLYELDDPTAKLFYIASDDINIIKEEINKNIDKEPTLVVISKMKQDLKLIKPFTNLRETFQYSYRGEIKEVKSDVEIVDMIMNDLGYLTKHYYRNGDDKEYFIDAINRGMLKVIKDNKIVGFIGEHPEHTLGMLYVDESYRRQGIGKALEQSQINKVLRGNRVPIEHVVLTNKVSQNLQNSFDGMVQDEGYIYWYF